MKNRQLYLSLAAATLLMASCSQEELAENQHMGDGLAMATTSSFTAFDEEGDTRSVVDPSGLPIAFKWASGDKLAIYSGGEASGMTNFDLVDGIDSEVATFKANGFSLTAGMQYYAFTPYNGNETDKTQIAVDYTGQVQAQNGSYSHLGAKDFQYSAATTAVTEDANNMTDFTLSHLGSVCRFQLTVPEAGVFTEFTLSGTALASEGFLNLTDGAFTCPIATDGSITLSLVTSSSSGISVAANGVLTLYMMLPKQNLSGKSLTATLNTNDSKTYSAKLTGKNIEGGHAYGWTASVKVPAKPLLDGTFSVSSTKKVQFTKSNLWWDGSDYHFEVNQTDYPTEPWDDNHVGHFFWTSSKDYQSGNASYMPYAQSYSYSSQSTSDSFFCGEDNPLTVDGTSGCYALSYSEWDYLISSRTNASSLRKYGVTVGDKKNCLIIAPDGFSSTLKSSYTLDEVSSLGLVCLPAAGNRGGSSFYRAESWGLYRSSTPLSSYSYGAYSLNFGSDNVNTNYYNSRSYGHSLRLVRNLPSTTTTHDYVEIGGKKWATMNLGATTVAGSYATCAGDFYAWGETTPRYTGISWSGNTATLTGISKPYNNSNYPSYTGTTLDAAHDAVTSHADWGEGWRTPTNQDFKDLYAACGGTGSWISGTLPIGSKSTTDKGIYWCNDYDGVAGLLFCDGTNKLFFPASGRASDTLHKKGGSGGNYWSSSLYTGNTDRAYGLYFYLSLVDPSDYSNLYLGFPVRPVSD